MNNISGNKINNSGNKNNISNNGNKNNVFADRDGNVFQNHTCLITAVDITNRKKEEEKLKRSENQFRNIFENATIGIYHSTPEGRFLKVNLKLVNMLGYTSTDELINGTTNINTQIYAEPETRPIILGAMMSKDGWVHFDKVLWRGKDGNTVILDMSSRKVLNPDGSIAYLEGIVADITAKTNSQELINQIRQNYETFFNTIDDFLFVLDEQGNITHTNTTVIDRLGYSSEELAGQSVLMVHPEERRAEAGRIVGEMLAGKSKFCPVPLITKAGDAIPVETKVKAGIWNGKPAIFGVTKDISQTKLSEEKFSKVFYLNPSACGLSDLQTGEYIEVNDAFYSLFGFTKEEVIGKTAIELGILTSETKKMILETADKSGIYSNIEADLKAKNGDIKHVLLSTENIFVQHVKLRYTVVYDITLRKQAEIALKDNEVRLKELNATKDKFFSIIGHDLRNPFNAIIGFSNLLTDQIKEKDYEGIEEYANIIQTSSVRAMSLLSDLLEWSQIQTGKMTFSPISFDLAKLVNEVLELANYNAHQKKITFINELPHTVIVFADISMIGTILRNLISNAIKFSNLNGQVVISVNQRPTELIVKILDNGIGIKEETIGKLFRIDEAYSTPGTLKETGTGLGLLLCKELVQKHGGEIWVESKFGSGSTFFFTIPQLLN